MNQQIEQKIKELGADYREIKRREEVLWLGFDKQVNALTDFVAEKFQEVLTNTDLSKSVNSKKRKVTINNFNVNYSVVTKDFDIEIEKWHVDIDGKEHSDRGGIMVIVLMTT